MIRKKTKGKSGTKGPLRGPTSFQVILVRVLLGLTVLAGGTLWWKAQAPKKRTAPSAIPPLVSGDGPTAYYLSQTFEFRIDGVRTLRGFTGFGDAPKLDSNSQGKPMKVKGKVYPRGIGAQAPSEIVFDLGTRVESFSCLAGVDEQAGGAASLHFIVKADGKKVFESPLMKSDSDPIPLALRVGGVKELALILDPAGNSDWDMGNWIDLKFRKGRP